MCQAGLPGERARQGSAVSQNRGRGPQFREKTKITNLLNSR